MFFILQTGDFSMNFKKLLALLLALSLLTGMAAATEAVEDVPLLSELTGTVPASNGYVVKLRSDVRRAQLQGNDALEPIAHAASYYTVQTLEELQPYLEAGLVESFDANVRVELFDIDPLTNDPQVAKQWYLENINAPTLWASSYDGSGVKVALIDSGVLYTHEDLAGANVTGRNFCGGVTDGVLQYTDRYTDTNANGHGTAVTGIIAARRNNSIGVAGLLENVQILSLRCFSPNNTSPENVRGNYVDTIISAVGYAMEQEVDVINMSLGVRQEVPTLESNLRDAANAVIILVASAGNYGTSDPNAVVYPASYDFVVSVAATRSDNLVTSTSQKNNQVTIAAPGNAIYSTSNNGSYAELSGTSLASPIAAALAAVVKQKDRAIGFDSFDKLLQLSAIDRGATGKDTSYGWGTIDAATLLAAMDAEYTIGYETNGGTLPAQYLAAYHVGQNAGAALPTPTRGAGDEFLGWYLDAGLTKGPYTSLPAGCAGNLTFYAAWKPVQLEGVTVKLVGLAGISDITATQDDSGVWTARLPNGTSSTFIAALGSANISVTGATATAVTRVAADGTKWSFTVDGTTYTLLIPLPKPLRLMVTWSGTATPASADGTIEAVACRMPVGSWFRGDVISYAKATTDLPSSLGTLGMTADLSTMIFTPTAAAAGQTLEAHIYARNSTGLSDPVTVTITVGEIPVPQAPGDVNNDGSVNAKDVAYLRRYLAGGYDAAANESIADVNKDGAVNAKDVSTLRRYLAGGYGIVLS